MGSAVTRALVGLQVDDEGKLLHRRTGILVTEPDTRRRLVAFFPGADAGKTSPVAGGWIPGVVIGLCHSDGRELFVYVDPEVKCWSELKGDWPLPPTFRRFIDWLMTNPSVGVRGRHRTDTMDDDDA